MIAPSTFSMKVDEDEFVYLAWNHRTNEYGIVITQPKFLLKTIFRNYCYLQGVIHADV
jgi:hypothetical protein